MDEQFEKLDPDACSKRLQMIRGVRDVGISCMWTLAGLGETGELFVNAEKGIAKQLSIWKRNIFFQLPARMHSQDPWMSSIVCAGWTTS